MNKIKINTEDRKGLTYKIGELVGVAPVYTGAGGNVLEGERFRFSYVVDSSSNPANGQSPLPGCSCLANITIAQDCTVIWDERTDAETMNKVFDGLAAAGYEFERPALETAETETPKKRKGIMDILVEELNANEKANGGTGEPVCFPESGMNAADVPTMLTIELPSINVKEDILRALIESKATLIKAALGEDGFGELPIEFDSGEGKVAFNWLRFGADADTIKAWSTFLAAACKFSKTAKRITAKDTAVENEKFAFRTFMVKIGMNGAEDKWARKFLLRNLKGDSAFATPESKAKWQAKHQKNGGAGNE